jgi:hypothetical protein
MEHAMPLNEVGRLWLDDARSRTTEEEGAQVVFAHHGPIDHQRIQDLLALSEEASVALDEGVSTRKRMMNVLVEGLENIHRHALQSHRDAGFALLVRTSMGYTITFGNAVPLAMAALLTHRVGILNEMDDTDLKEHYLKLLANSARSDQGGAGLGLLTMARKCKRPIHVRTTKLCPQSALLTLELRVEG